jgi:hypothetical protein
VTTASASSVTAPTAAWSPPRPGCRGKLLPEPIGITGVTKIAGGDAALLQVSSAAIRSDGTLWTWGCDAFGQLGHSGATGAVPRQVTNLAGVTAFAFGDDTGSLLHQGGYSLAVGWIPATVPNLIGDTVAQAGQALNAAGAAVRLRHPRRRLHLHQHRPGDVAEPGRGRARQRRLRGLGQGRYGLAAAARMPVTWCAAS